MKHVSYRIWLILVALFSAHLLHAQDAHLEALISQPTPEALKAQVFESVKIDPSLYLPVQEMRASKGIEGQKHSVVNEIRILNQDGSGYKASVFVKVSQPAALYSIPGFEPTTILPSGRIAVGWMQLQSLDDAAAHPALLKMEASKRSKALNEAARQATRTDSVHSGAGSLPRGYYGEDVVVGVLDTGIDFNSDDFADENGTRIQFLMDMQADGTNRVWTKAEIDANPAAVTQRDGFGGGGHGTHVAGSAAGGGSMNAAYTGVAPKADIIFVKGIREANSDGGFSDADVITGIDFIFEKAQEMGKPAVVNLSLGGNFGPRDGTSLYEQAITDLQGAGRIIVAAAGNEGLDFLHTGAEVSPNTAYISVDVPSNDVSFSKEIWYDPNTIIQFGLVVFEELEDGRLSSIAGTPWLNVGSTNYDTERGYRLADDQDNPLGFVWYNANNTVDANNGDGQIVIHVDDGVNSDTTAAGNDYAFIDQYKWGIIYRTNTGEGRFDVMNYNVKSYDRLYNFGESYTYLPGDNAQSVGSPATANGVISVGAFVSTISWDSDDGNTYTRNYARDFDYEDIYTPEMGQLAYFSSQGPTRDGRVAPMITAPGDQIFSVRSTHIEDENLSASKLVENGRYLGMQGTSMASPHVAGIIALMLEADPSLDATSIQNILTETAISDGFTGTLPNMQFGQGKINALAAVEAVAPEQQSETGNISGIVTDATNGQPLPGVEISVAGLSTTTDSEGAYLFENVPLASPRASFTASPLEGAAPLQVQFTDLSSLDAHELRGTKQGYSDYYNDMVVVTQGGSLQLNFSLSPVLGNADLRMVLSWGENPRDIDSHLLTPEIEGQNYHVYYSSRGDSSRAPYALLDHDDTSSFGPETITIVRRFDGTYHYYVYNYSGSPDIKTSEAKVQIYNQNGLLQTVRVPETGEGRYWHVAQIDGATGAVSIVNQIQATAPSTSSKLALQPMPDKLPSAALLADIAQWSWDFGDGNSSAEQNPLHTYQQNGSYDVSLSITVDDQAYSTTQEGYIIVGDSTGGPIDAPERIQAPYGPPAEADTWTLYEIPITPESFGVSEAQLRALLANVSKMRIGTEMHTGDDKGSLDSVAVGERYFADFDMGNEGWSAEGDGTLGWEENGGVGGAHISIEDWATGEYHFATAPSSWRGDWSELYGEKISFWYKTTNPSYEAMVELYSTDQNRIIMSAAHYTLGAGERTSVDLTLIPGATEQVLVDLHSANTNLTSPYQALIQEGENGTSFVVRLDSSFTGESTAVLTASLDGYPDARITFNLREKARASIQGQVTNALNGQPIEGAQVMVGRASTLTDAEGNYLIENVLPSQVLADFTADRFSGQAPLEVHFTDITVEGLQSIKAFKNGFSDYLNSEVFVQEGQALNYNFSLSPVMNNAALRLVLSWGENPRDLDSHLLSPEIEGSSYHIYYGSRGDSTRAPYALLDHDDQSSYGPETVTITQLFEGTYHYYIYNYSGSPDIITSEAKVQIYNQSGLLQTVRIPESGEGKYWYVARIDGANGQVEVINQVQSTPPSSSSKLAESMPAKTFTDSVINSSNWQWNFGDGHSSSEQHPNHIFTEPGLYDVHFSLDVSGRSYHVTKTGLIEVRRLTDIDQEVLPQDVQLHQNYPNPFNPSTSISFDLPQSMHVQLNVYNMLGQRVQTLIDQAMTAGSHQVMLDAKDMPSGVYLYELQTPQGRMIRKMSLIK